MVIHRREQYLRETNSPGKVQRLAVNAECQLIKDSWYLCGWQWEIRNILLVVCVVVDCGSHER